MELLSDLLYGHGQVSFDGETGIDALYAQMLHDALPQR
jgi:hypothetical protein